MEKDTNLQNMAEHFRQNNDVGGGQYTEAEQQLIYEITLRLQGKRGVHKVTYEPDPSKQLVPVVLPKHYMLMYAKAAAGIYEMARALSSLSSTTLPGVVPIMDWIKIITGETFNNLGLPAVALPEGREQEQSLPAAALPEAEVVEGEYEHEQHRQICTGSDGGRLEP